MANCPHTHFKKGSSLFVILKTGETFFDKFVEKKAKYIILREHGKIMKNKLRSISFAKLPTND